MESDSQSGSSEEPPSQQRVANLIGTLIAVLTLVLPLLVIIQYSETPIRVLPETPYPMQGFRDS